MHRRGNLRGAEPLAAVGLGALAGTAWQPLGWWPAIFVALAGLVMLLGRDARGADVRRALRLGWLFGLGMCAVAIGWVHVIGWYVVPPLVAFMALWSGVVALVVTAAHRLSARPLVRALLGACGWSLAEFGACRFPFGGFGWLRLAYTQVDSPLAGWLPAIGVAGLSLVVATLAALLGEARGAAGTAADRALLGVTALLLLVGAPLAATIPAGPAHGSVTVGVVQGNLDGGAGPHEMGYARSVTNNHVSQTVTLMARARAGADPMPDFVLWPENSTDIDPRYDLQTDLLIRRASAIAERPILVGAVTRGPGADERQTTGLWWPVDGQAGPVYHKRNLVPFGEWIPMRSQLLPLLPILEQTGAQSVPGTSPGILGVTIDGRPLVIGDIVCFELAWDSTVHDTVTHGAEILVVQSNNGTYKGTGQPVQQFAITRARAMEMRREVVVSTTNALSGLVRADGSVSWVTTQGTADSRSVTVARRSGTTPALTVGPLVELLAAGIALAQVGGLLRDASRRRRTARR